MGIARPFSAGSGPKSGTMGLGRVCVCRVLDRVLELTEEI
jgi:hypothetical protein